MHRAPSSVALLIAICALAGQVLACELPPIMRKGLLKDERPGVPSREAVRVVGVVTGYGTVNRPVARLANLTGIDTLRIRIEDVVSGRIGKGDSEVVLMGVGSDCSSKPDTTLEYLKKNYAMGSRVVVIGEVTAPFGSQPSAIIAEANQGASIGLVPPGVRRIATGELDFRIESGRGFDRFMQFEFERALLMLANAPIKEQFTRLRNIAAYSYAHGMFRADDRVLYARLVAEMTLTVPQREQLMKVFDDLSRELQR